MRDNCPVTDTRPTSLPELQQRLRSAMVAAGGWLPFDRFMAMALYEPGLGYYTNALQKFGAMPASGSDFVTAPGLTPLFGQTLAVQVGDALDKTGTDEVFEFGAGTGALALQLLDALGDRVRRYTIIDLSGTLRERQAQTLAAHAHKVRWLSAWPEALEGVVVGNEVLDAMPVQLLVRKWEKKGRLPDAIVMEHPRLAGGHLGAARVADLNDTRFEFEVAVPEVLKFLKSAGLEGQIPLVLAGGIWRREDIVRLQTLGACAVQLGTAFAVTEECDADPGFKHVLAQAKAEDIVEFVSVAGLPARAVKTPWLEKYLRIEPVLQAAAHVKKKCNMSFDCLVHCGLRDGKSDIGQFCIDQQLGHAMRGDYSRGLFFRGAGRLPFGSEIRPVHHLLHWLLAGMDPLAPKMA
mgnify:CR=1 FL=1